MTFEERYFSGKCLFGDDLDAEGLAKWYADEERGYYDLAKSFNWGYDHYALDRFNLFDRLPQKHYPVCIASGCAGGDELQSVADRVGRFIAIEPAEAIWRKEPVGITPIEYMKPSVSGDIALPSSSVDLSIWLSSLHHVPNVSHALGEMVRILRPGGNMVLREPISTMGDWRKPRSGLTPNERGFPLHWMDEKLISLGLSITSRRLCCFAGTPIISRWLRQYSPYDSKLVVRLDRMACLAFSWNLYYHRDRRYK